MANPRSYNYSKLRSRRIVGTRCIDDAPADKREGIIINIDVMLAKRKMSVTELSERVGITMANLSILKNGHAKAIRLSTLEAICKALECQPGDILEYK